MGLLLISGGGGSQRDYRGGSDACTLRDIQSVLLNFELSHLGIHYKCHSGKYTGFCSANIILLPFFPPPHSDFHTNPVPALYHVSQRSAPFIPTFYTTINIPFVTCPSHQYHKFLAKSLSSATLLVLSSVAIGIKYFPFWRLLSTSGLPAR
jgi:hypothetical protein